MALQRLLDAKLTNTLAEKASPHLKMTRGDSIIEMDDIAKELIGQKRHRQDIDQGIVGEERVLEPWTAKRPRLEQDEPSNEFEQATLAKQKDTEGDSKLTGGLLLEGQVEESKNRETTD